MLLKFLKWCRGYADAEIESEFPERFLNLCAKDNINLWKTARTENGLKFRVAAYDLECARFIAMRLGLRFEVKHDAGGPAMVKKYRKRKAFFIGGLLFVTLIIVLSQFIWSIQITGLQTITEEEVRYELAKRGCKIGVIANSIDSSDLADRMRIAVPEISWIALNIRGSSLSVEIKERDMKPDMVDLNTPSDVVAAKDGIILSMELADGEKKVSDGSVVAKGDILAAGTLYGERNGYRFVPARGKVYAKTSTKIRSTAPKSLTEKTPTGQKVTKRTLNLFGLQIKLYFSSSISYPEYDKITKIKQVKITNQIVLPISVITEEYLECTKETRQLSYEEQLAICRARRDELFVKGSPNAEVLNYGEQVIEKENEMVLVTEITAKEDIAKIIPLSPEDMQRLREEDAASREKGKTENKPQ